jgi:hypothetical protein
VFTNSNPRPAKGSFDRRNFLQVGSVGLLGLSLEHCLAQRSTTASEKGSARAKNVIMIFLSGGPPTIDMWDMKPDAPLAIRGEFQTRDTSVPGVRICEHLPLLAKEMHRVTLVRSLTHTIAEHTQGTAYVMTGNRPNPAFEWASLGSLSASLFESKQGVPVYMTMGSVASAGAGELGNSFNPFEVATAEGRGNERNVGRIGLPAGFTVTDLERRQKVLERLDRRMRELDATPLPKQLGQFQRDAFEILRTDKINKALDLENESEARRKQYGGSFIGQSTLAARRLIEAGARFVTIGIGDWDTHANNFTRLRTSLLPQLDTALAALLADLGDSGLLDETIVYCTGEFGRTPQVNSTAGRDHWSRAMSALLAGGGFRPGLVYGETTADGSEPAQLACSPDDLSASIFQQLGFAPNHQVQTQGGRPIALFRNGRAIEGLVS